MSNNKNELSVVSFMEKYSKLSVGQKLNALERMKKDRRDLTPGERKTFLALKDWCGMSIMVGEELCPPTAEHLASYLRDDS